MKKITVMLVFAGISSVATADICGIVTKDQAEKSLSLLTKGTQLIMSDDVTSTITIKGAAVKKETTMDGVDYYDLFVFDKSSDQQIQIDPGHTAIVFNSKANINMGRLVGCDNPPSDPNVIVNTPLSDKNTQN